MHVEADYIVAALMVIGLIIFAAFLYKNGTANMKKEEEEKKKKTT